MRVTRRQTHSGAVWRLGLEADGRDAVVITAAGIAQLAEQLDAAERSTSCRVIVLEGAPGSFCQGMDLEGVGAEDSAGLNRTLTRYAECLTQLRGCSKHLLALVDGAVLAGGIGLAAAADLVVATERAVFGLPEVMLGLVPAMVLPVLLERIPAQKARRLALSAVSIDASQALALGLADRVVHDGSELERALRTELRTLLRTEPSAVAALKRFTTQAKTLEVRDAIGAGRDLTAGRLARADIRQAIEAFVAGEPLPWFTRRGAGSAERGHHDG